MISAERLEEAKLQFDKIAFDLRRMVKVADEEQEGKWTDEQQKEYEGLGKKGEEKRKEIETIEAALERRNGGDSVYAALDKMTGGSMSHHDRLAAAGGNRILVSRFTAAKSFGTQFVQSEAFAWLKKNPNRPDRWETPTVEIPRDVLVRFATLTEDQASGGALVVPDYQPTIHPGATLPVVVADLLAPGTTGSNSVPVMIEKTFTNAAAPVAEGAAKPESTLIYESAAEPVRKIAHWLPVTEELLDDAQAAASQIDAKLRYGVLRVEDYQLLFGTGVAPQLQGILVRTGLAPDIARVDPMTNADVILTQIVMIESTTGLPVSGVVMNPLAWAATIGFKLTTGEYLAGGPFGSPTAPMIWNRQVALTDQITPTTALVGAFKMGAQIFRRGGVSVAASNSHASFFIENKVAIRAEERLALAVYRPAAFGKVTGLTTANVTP